jgi:geranylgeranyl pyrophosphate synthase
MVLDTEVLDVSMEMAKDYVRRAVAALQPLPANAARASMIELGDYVLARRS